MINIHFSVVQLLFFLIVIAIYIYAAGKYPKCKFCITGCALGILIVPISQGLMASMDNLFLLTIEFVVLVYALYKNGKFSIAKSILYAVPLFVVMLLLADGHILITVMLSSQNNYLLAYYGISSLFFGGIYCFIGGILDKKLNWSWVRP